MISSPSRLASVLTVLLSVSCSLLSNTPGQKIKLHGPVTYKEIGDKLISSFGIVKEKNEELTEEDRKKLLKEIRQLSEHEKLTLLFSLMGEAAPTSSQEMPEAAHNAMRILLKELETFYGQGQNSTDHLFSKIDCTRTVFGQAALASMVAQPIDDIELLSRRQNLVRELVQNEQLFQQVDETMKQLATKESDLLSFWQDEDTVGKKVRNALYFNNRLLTWVNKFPWALSSLSTLIELPQQATVIPSLMFQSLPTISAYWGFRFSGENKDIETKRNIVIENNKTNIFLVKAALFPFKMLLDKEKIEEINEHMETAEKKFKAIAANDKLVEQQYEFLANTLGKSKWKTTAWAGVFATMNAFWLKKLIQNKIQEQTALRYMQTRLTGARALIDTMQKIQALAEKNGLLADGLLTTSIATENLNERIQKCSGLAKLISLLESNTFNGNYSYFSRSGNILVSFNMMQELKNEFAGIMQAVGELDACLSIAKLYKKLQNNENATYCFVEFLDQDKPYLKLDQFWNPLIDPETVVTNSIELGATNGPRNALITGSNTGGKSTILKATVINILLSRLGIAPARKAVMTPFTYLATSLNISDDTAGGISLFNAEVLRAKSIIESLNSLDKNQHAFVAIDELFVGTASEKGSVAACKFTEYLSKFENTILALATHFKQVTNLERKTNGICKNYKVDIFKDENGNLVRPFILEEGISQNNVANEILQENISGISFL